MLKRTEFSGAVRPRPGCGRAGMSLVELLVALLLFSAGVLALVTTAALLTRQMTSSWELTRGASIGLSRLEALSSVSCKTVSSGTASDGPYSERWVVTTGTSLMTVVDTVRTPFGRTTRTQVYGTTIYCP